MYNQMTQLFSLSKTLRFELKPVGETAKYIEDFQSEFLKETVQRDERRAQEYKQVKEIIDDYFRIYIDDTLSIQNQPESFLGKEHFEEAFGHYKEFRRTKLEESKKIWESTQKELREQVASLFKKGDYEVKGKFFKDVLLPKIAGDEAKEKLVKSFDKFTTYFTGFNENRKNIFTKEEKSTSIGYRLIHDNLPKFFDACLLYKNARDRFKDLEFDVEQSLIEQLRVTTLDEVFQLATFAHLLTQKNIETYNALLGGYVDDRGIKHQGLNEQINQYRQQKNLKGRELPFFAPLFKQILAKTESRSFIPEAFANDKEMLDAIRSYIERANEQIIKLEKSLSDEMHSDKEERIYVKKQALSGISQEVFGTYTALNDMLYFMTQNDTERFRTKKQKETFLAKTDFYALDDVEDAVKMYMEMLDDTHPYKEAASSETLLHTFFKDRFQKLKDVIEEVSKSKEMQEVLSLDSLSKDRRLPKDENDSGGEGYKQAQRIKELLEAYQEIARLLKSLYPSKGRKRVDVDSPNTAFYNSFEEPFVEYENETIAFYNKVRNYLTKKPYKTDKFRLTFDIQNFLNGFVDSRTDSSDNGTQYGGYLFREKLEDGSFRYYLGVSKHKKLFRSNSNIEDPHPSLQRLEYYQGKAQSVFGSSYDGNFDEDKNQLSSEKLIKKIKLALKKYKDKILGIDELLEKPYDDYKELTNDINEVFKNKVFNYHDISWKEFETAQANREKPFFLFEIYNKDFSRKKSKKNYKAKDNLHTLYIKGLMNEKGYSIDIGKGEVFFRRHSIKVKEPTHKAYEAILNKDKNNPKKESVFKYDIIKDRRYTIDKFMFHLSVELNYKAPKVPKKKKKFTKKFNDTVNRLLAENSDTHIIGIDRGERHLLYYTVIDPNGVIVEQGSFNAIPTDKGYEVDYRHKLDAKEHERDKARKDWGSIENIKELKAGYLSQVIHQLSKLIVKYNAVVMLEDLNFGFKRGRFKVEKQVYQKFEKALIDKLNYLVFKDKKAKEPGGYLNGYQLTAPFESFQSLGKQSGILFYVPAAYTSKIDPASGFVNLLKPKYESVSQAQGFFSNFDAICYNNEEDYFEFSFRYSRFGKRYEGYKDDWAVCTHGVRLRNEKEGNYWVSKEVNVTAELKELFEKHGISYTHGNDLKEAILQQEQKAFFEKLLLALRTVLAMRYSRIGEEEDYLLSPVKAPEGTFFDSRKAKDNEPKDADANGAYHIALKGAMVLERIKNHDFSNSRKLDLHIKQAEWFAYVSQRIWGE